MIEIRPSQRRNLIWSALMQIFCGGLRPDEPTFSNWDKLAKPIKEGLKQLTSDDIKDDYSSLWIGKDETKNS